MKPFPFIATLCAVFPLTFSLTPPNVRNAASRRSLPLPEPHAIVGPLTKRSGAAPDFFNPGGPFHPAPPTPRSFKRNDKRRLPAPHDPIPGDYGVPHDHPVIARKLAAGAFGMTRAQSAVAARHWGRARAWRRKQQDLVQMAQARGQRAGRTARLSPLEEWRYRYHAGRHQAIDRKARDRVADLDEDVRRAREGDAAATGHSWAWALGVGGVGGGL